MTKIAIIRFSALGDVAMLVPVIRSAALLNPNVQFTIISRQQTKDLWSSLPANVIFHGADLKGRHHGTKGLKLLLQELDYKSFDAVADMHSVLRSWYLDFKWFLAGKHVVRINKGRLSKRWLTSPLNHHKHPLKPTLNRYTIVLRKLGIPVETTHASSPQLFHANPRRDEACLVSPHSTPANPCTDGACSVSPLKNSSIGIAPFAAHPGKIYPLEKTEQLVAQLSKTHQILLFGGGKRETEILERWASIYNNVSSMAGKHSLKEELEIIRGLKLMITMDSANMHLASLVGTRVISIWGATDPKAGFLGYGQSPDDCIMLDLPCRPCSIYGNKPCRYHNYPCLNIPPETIISKISK